MNPETVQRLLALNQQFYALCAAAFARSRGAGQAGLLPTLPYLPSTPTVLDLGCGNGRLARWLAGQRQALTYVGLDASAPLVRAAAQTVRSLDGVHARLVLADVTHADWPAALPALTPAGAAFDAVYILALLHHLPGFELRAAVLRQAGQLLAPGGALIVTFWQFLDDARWQGRLLPWETVGLTASQVESGDALLDWRRDQRGLRYVHHVSPAEAEELARAAGLQVIETYRADGQNKRLNLFQICRAQGLSPQALFVDPTAPV
jgi:SAM-dependent methyltransferase